MYHKLDNQYLESKLSVCPDSFRKQMDFLRKNDYNVVSLKELVSLIKSGRTIPRNTVTITFDDGYENNYDCAYPVLRMYRIPATIFITAENMGKEGFLTWQQVREMAENGVDIGSHGMTDVIFTEIKDKERLKNEIFKSKELIEGRIGKKVNFISYPLGQFNENIIDMVKDAGYLGACATNPGGDYPAHDPYALKRIRISRTSDSLFVFFIESSGYYTFIKEVRDED
jgi:peptidoglycan/xylan/chitin deacetylase (PgdA/CDA1 family)